MAQIYPTIIFCGRSAIVVSEPINFLHDHARFFAILKGFGSLDIRRWGYEMFLAPPNGDPDNPPGSKLIPANGRVSRKVFEGYRTLPRLRDFMSKKIIYQQHCLIGRCTLVESRRCEDNQGPTNEQSSDQLCPDHQDQLARTSEQSFIQQVIDAAKQHNVPWVTSHIPQFFLGQDIENEHQGPQRRLQDILEDAHEERVMRIVFQRALIPTTQLTTAGDLLIALRGIFMCTCTTPTYALSLFTIYNRL
jgi:hypothetical protein